MSWGRCAEPAARRTRSKKDAVRPANETEQTVHLQRASRGPAQAMEDGQGVFVHGVRVRRAYDAGPRCRNGEGRRGWVWGVVKRGAWSHPKAVPPLNSADGRATSTTGIGKRQADGRRQLSGAGQVGRQPDDGVCV